jgi:hypothetical protein
VKFDETLGVLNSMFWNIGWLNYVVIIVFRLAFMNRI